MGTLPLTDRQKKVYELVKLRDSVGLDDICQELNMSESTARRILSTLEKQSYILRFRGGAMMPPAENTPEPPVVHRAQESLREKRAIARTAASYIHNGDTLLLTSGSTVLQICPFLEDFKGLTVLTDSLLVQNALAHSGEICVVLLGGILNADEQCTYGFLTTENASRFKIDLMFSGTKALNIQRGCMTDDMQHMPLYRNFMELSDRVIILADHTKLHQRGSVVLFSYSEINHLLMDEGVPQHFVRALTDSGCPVSLCPLV